MSWREKIDTSIYWCCGRRGEMEIQPPPKQIAVKFVPSLRCPHCGKSGGATRPGSLYDFIAVPHTDETLREAGIL